MIRHISSTGLVMGVSFFLSMLTTLILGNLMTSKEFGDFALLKNFILIGATFSIFGLDLGNIRRSNDGNPVLDYKIVNIISIFLSGIFAVIMMIIFELSTMNFFYLWGIIFGAANVLYLASVYRLSHYFAFAQLIQNCWKILLFIIVLITFIRTPFIGINQIYFYLFIALISVVTIHYFFKSSALKCDKSVESKEFGNNVIKDGMILWMINVLALIFAGMDRFIIPVIADKAALGTYYALSFVFITGFTVIGSAVGYVLYPYLTQGKIIPWRRVTYYFSSVIVALLILLLFKGQLIASLAFNGKYDFAIQFNTIVLLCFLGILQCVHTIIHFYIYAKASNKALINYILYLFLYCIVYYISFIYMAGIIEYSILSIIQHILILWILKVIISLVMSFYITQKSSKLSMI